MPCCLKNLNAKPSIREEKSTCLSIESPSYLTVQYDTENICTAGVLGALVNTRASLAQLSLAWASNLGAVDFLSLLSSNLRQLSKDIVDRMIMISVSQTSRKIFPSKD